MEPELLYVHCFLLFYEHFLVTADRVPTLFV
jgi:hypothetical protein